MRTLYLDDTIYTFSVIDSTDKLFSIEIRAMKAGMCANGWDFTEDAILESMNTFRGMAILCAYKFGEIGDGHNFEVRQDLQGNLERDYRGADAERIVGYIPQDSNIRLETRDDEMWLIIPAVLFRFYNSQLVEDILQKGYKSVSVEIETPEKWVELLEDGRERIHRFDALGITILGGKAKPAITGAELRALSKSVRMRELSVKAAAYLSKTKFKKGVNQVINKTEILKHLTLNYKDDLILNVSNDGNAFVLLKKDGQLEMRSLEKNIDCNVHPIIKAIATLESKDPDENGKYERVCEIEINDLIATCTKELEAKNESLRKELEESKAKGEELEKENAELKEQEEARKKEEFVTALQAERKKECGDPEDTKVLEADFNYLVEKAKQGEYLNVKDCIAEFAVLKWKRIHEHKKAQQENSKRIDYASVEMEEDGTTLNPKDLFDSLPSYD